MLKGSPKGYLIALFLHLRGIFSLFRNRNIQYIQRLFGSQIEFSLICKWQLHVLLPLFCSPFAADYFDLTRFPENIIAIMKWSS